MRFIHTETGNCLGHQSRRKVTLQHVRRFYRTHLQKFLELIFPNHQPQRIVAESAPSKKEYEAPTVRKLTLEQAKLILIGHASIGDQGAKELMDIAFPEPGFVEPTADRRTAQAVTRS